MPLSKSGPASGFSATTVPCLDRLEVTQELEVPFIKTSSVVVGLNVGMCWYIAVLSVNASAPCTTVLMCDQNEAAGIFVEGINDLYSVC